MWLALVMLGGLLAAGTVRAASWWRPPQRLTWYWQLSGTPTVEPVQATDVDGFDTSAAIVAAFHARGQRMICYIDVGTAENWRSDYTQFPAGVLGSGNGWPGEQWLDIRQLSVLEPIMTARFQMCHQKGFDAVEPDNIDGYENDTGFPLSAADQLAYDEWVAQEVHSLGMAVLQKNDPDQADQLEPYFDGALDEQCNQYQECGSYAPYLTAGKPVLNAEYDASLYPGFCTADDSAGIMGAVFDTALDGATYQPCFGPSPPGPPITGSGGGSGAGGGPGGGSGSGTGAPSSAAGRLDRRAPRVAIGAGPLDGRRGVVRVLLRCPSGQSYCQGTLRLATVARFAVRGHGARRALVLGTARFRIRGGRSNRVAVRLVRGAVLRLGRKTRVGVVVAVRARDAAGRRAGSRRRCQLRLARRR